MVTALVIILLSPLLLVNLVFVAETMLGLARGPKQQWQAALGRTAIVVPAHNEAQVIGRTLTALSAAVAPNFAILVVADNCSDDTAALARALHAEVIERTDPILRGKGHALAFARDWLRRDPPEAVIVLDADCRTDRGSLISLTSACQQLQRPAQAINLLEPSSSSGPLVQLSCFAFLVKNLVRQRGLQRLAGSVHLTGTGMSLPWTLFNRADLATSSIVEDIRLGIELGQGGAHPTLIQESIVWSPHAEESQTIGQRSRWEGGFLALARATAPRLITEAVRSLSLRAMIAGFDLLVPPLALLAILNCVMLLTLAGLAALGVISWLPALVLSTTGGIAAVTLLLAWWREGRAFLSPAALARLPLYVLWKIPMYLRIVRSGAPKVWQRTERVDETGHEAAPPSA
jgi:cellulose synthase/poly-beta-1,6-N-acetylglucosamine synthase-like glycosyltransferase